MEPRALEDVGQTLSTDWCHRSDPIVQAGGEAAGRCGTEAKWGGGGATETESGVRYYWVGEIYTIANFKGSASLL